MKLAEERNYGLDYLRILSAFAVILLHVNATWLNELISQGTYSAGNIVGNTINLITRFSVPCFLMISGYFVLGNEKNGDFSFFYKKSLLKLGIPYILMVIFWALYGLVDYAFEEQGIIEFAKYIIQGTYGNLWYMPMLICIYLVAPFIIRIKKVISEKTYFICALILLLWAVISQTTSSYLLPYSTGVVFSYMSYFILGDTLRSLDKRKSSLKLMWGGVHCNCAY